MLTLNRINKHFGDIKALDHVSFSIPTAEHRILLGPSGSGKTTLLRVIAGLEHQDSGTIHMGKVLVSSSTKQIPPWNRNLGFVFQESTLWPHMTVWENITFGKQKNSDTRGLVEQLGIQDLLKTYPKTLSGGQSRRVSLARALASQPRFLLLDEPFSNLDLKSRNQLLQLTKKTAISHGATVLFVTHQHDEAKLWNAPTIRMENGRISKNNSSD